MPLYIVPILLAGWIAWSTPFFFGPSGRKKAATVDPRARWGILLEAIGFSIIWQGPFWTRSPAAWQIALGVVFFALAATLSWTARRALAQFWRFDAGLDADHKLVQSGPYRVVRHPIYTSMFCLLLGTGFLVSWWPLLIAGAVIFVIGTEIRVRIEDALLASRFGDDFQAYRQKTAAYIPGIR